MTVRAPHAARRAARVPSPAERRLSWLIVSLLPLIAAAIYAKGRAFDPGLFALDPAALVAPAARTSPSSTAALLRTDPELPAPATKSFALPRHLSGLEWDADGPAEAFTPQTLYQKIDGRADEYLKNGFTHLDAISYAKGAQFVDVLVYDMGTDAHARARFAAERPGAATPLAGDPDTYCIESSCFVLRGSRYAQVIGSDAAMQRAAGDAARAIAVLLENAALSRGAGLSGPRNP